MQGSGQVLLKVETSCPFCPYDRDLLTVQQLLGHSSPQTTAIYIETSPDAAAAAVAGVAA
jgi:integrase